MKAQTMNIIKMLSKPTTERMPFEGVELTKFLQRIPFFKRMFHTQSEKFISLCLSSQLKEFEEGQDLYKDQKQPQYVYILLEGTIHVETKQTRVSRIVEAFDLIGNVEVVFSMSKRAETAITEGQTTCMVLDAQPLMRILKEKEEIEKSYHYLKINSYFQSLSGYDKKSLTLLMKKQSFQKGQTIIFEGQPNKKVFFIIHGRLNITKKINLNEKQREILLDIVQEMDSHGQHESLNCTKSDVKMVAATTGSFYSIDIEQVREKKNLFLQCIRQYAFPYPDHQQIEFRYKIQSDLEKQKKKVVKKMKYNIT